MSLGFPAGLWALVALGPLVAAYFLRRRQPPLRVSALFLWRTPDQRAQGGPRFHRFSRELSLLLEALAIIAAALFLADARFGEQAPKRHVVMVVDGSLSMAAQPQGGPAIAERVRSRAAKLVDDENASAVTLVESGVRPRLLAGPQEAPSRALAALEGWRPAGPAHDPTASLVFAREVAGAGQRVFFLTDGMPPAGSPVSEGVEWIALGQSLENAALISAQRKDDGEVATVTVRMVSYAGSARAVRVAFDAEPAVEGGKPVHQEETAEVSPGASRALRVTFKRAGVVRVSLPDDALALDGKVTLLPAPPRRVRVSVLTGLPPVETGALRRFVAANRPAVTEEGQEPALSFGPRGSQAQVTFGAPGKLRSFVGPFFTRKEHPLLDDVELAGVVWTAGDNPPGRALVTAGDAVLMAEDEDGVVHLNIDMSRSNVHRTPAWPVLLANVVERARARLPGLPKQQVVLGEEVPVVAEPGARYVLDGPDGARPILGVGAVQLSPPRQPGRYRLLRDGKLEGELEVMAIDPHESDLRERGEGRVGARGVLEAGLGAPSQRRQPWLLLVLLVLLFADFALTARNG